MLATSALLLSELLRIESRAIGFLSALGFAGGSDEVTDCELDVLFGSSKV